MKDKKIWLIALVILLVFAVGYIAYDKYMELRDADRLNVYQQGMQVGYEQAVVKVMSEAARCQPVPLYAENQTINLIAVDCLQQAGQGK